MPQTSLGELFTSVMNTVPNEETIAAKANTANPVFTGSISLGRKSNTTNGSDSIAVGNYITASGNYSSAFGYKTIASGVRAHAEGFMTEASGADSHAEGQETKANGKSTYASGRNNVLMTKFPTWTANTEYAVGDKVIYGVPYICITANNDETFNSDKWQIIDYDTYQAFVVGNGTADNARSNALTLDWTGDLHLMGDLYTGANANGTGGTKLDTSILAPKASPVFTGSISLGRKASTTVGSNSFAVGNDAVASGAYAHAEGKSTTASGEASHAEGIGGTFTINSVSYTSGATEDGAHSEGLQTLASNYYAHAEGRNTIASGAQSHAEGLTTEASGSSAHAEGNITKATGIYAHAEGYNTQANGATSHAEGGTTIANGSASHAEGAGTIAEGSSSHVGGTYNIADSYDNLSEWTANTAYQIGDRVKKTTISNNNTSVSGYICKIANEDASFQSYKWTNLEGKMNYAEIIGNGADVNNRSNARALDWSGNEYIAGDLYVGCGADSTSGTKLARIPAAPSTDGTYTLQCVVTNGEPTYTWISTGA